MLKSVRYIGDMAGGPIQRSKEVLGGTPVFSGTRVPVQSLLDYIEDGMSIDDFLGDFPTTKRQQVIAVLEAMKEALVGRQSASAA